MFIKVEALAKKMKQRCLYMISKCLLPLADTVRYAIDIRKEN